MSLHLMGSLHWPIILSLHQLLTLVNFAPSMFLLVYLLCSLSHCLAYQYESYQPYGKKAVPNKGSLRSLHSSGFMEEYQSLNNYEVTYLVTGKGYNTGWPDHHQYGHSVAGSNSQPQDYFSFVPKQEVDKLINIEAPTIPLVLNFQTRSSKIVALQNHIPNEVEDITETESVEKPHKLVHIVMKPVIQEIKEIITPYRKIVQEIKPVQEQVFTIVAKKEPRPLSSSGLLGAAGSVPPYKYAYAKKS